MTVIREAILVLAWLPSHVTRGVAIHRKPADHRAKRSGFVDHCLRPVSCTPPKMSSVRA